jgi:AraC-type DNA-binding domain-containing proteins
VAIINTDNEFREKSEQALRIDFHKIQLEISKVLDNTITIAYGRCYPERSNIKDSFNEAQDALKKRLIFGHGNIIEWGAESTEANKYYYPYVIEKHIFNNLGLGMKEETIAAIEELVRDIKNRDYLSPDNILQIFIQIVGNTVKHLVDKNINTSDIFGNEYNIYQKLSTKETIDEIEAWLKGFYSGIMEYSKDSESQIQNNSESVLDFIRKNYASDIDVTAIADYAGISYSYVRKIVKEKTGKSVVDYVNGLRIEEAKRLLRQTNLNIIEIATNIGYNNDQSFNRFFKKYEGITPGEFRSIC